MSRGKKIIIAVCSLIGAAILIYVVWFLLAFFGNPISKALANSTVGKHIEENYSDLNLEVDDAFYNFKFGQYMVHAKSPTSIDTQFTLYTNWLGTKITRDSYDSVTSGYNTFYRFDEEFRAAVEPIIEENLPYEIDMVIASLKANANNDFSSLKLDSEYDPFSNELPSHVTLYIYTDDVSWENVAKVALELDRLLTSYKLDISSYDVVLSPIAAKEDYSLSTLGIYDFESELLKESNLPDFMKSHFEAWDIKNGK